VATSEFGTSRQLLYQRFGRFRGEAEIGRAPPYVGCASAPVALNKQNDQQIETTYCSGSAMRGGRSSGANKDRVQRGLLPLPVRPPARLSPQP
jgi:hypothetical protein